MVTDFQAAWTELMSRVAVGGSDGKKTSWGQNELLQEMGKIAGEHRVPEDLLEAATRLISGFPFTMQSAETTPATDSDSVSEDGMEIAHRPPNDQGGHDGQQHHSGGDDSPPGSGSRNGRLRATQPA